jgi:hypothetical protein
MVISNTPPDKPSKAGEWILKNYARATNYIGLHFESYDDFIFSPVIKTAFCKPSHATMDISPYTFLLIAINSYCHTCSH